MNASVPQAAAQPATQEPPFFSDLSGDEARALLAHFAEQDVLAFAEVFDRVAVPVLGTERSFAVLREFALDDKAACMMAATSAISHGFAQQLADAMAITPGLAVKAARLLGSTGTRQMAEGVLDTVNGLRNTVVLGDLCRVTNALCLVYDGYRSMGTGILIDHDLVLTAAHVLDNCGYRVDGSANPAIRRSVTLKFNSPHLPGKPYVAQLANDWLVAYSPACIHIEGHALSAASANMLDFALLRLSAAVPGHVHRLPISPGGRLPPLPLDARERKRRYYLLGYPGGSDSKFSMGTIDDIHSAAARILHLCDSVAGMSGAPLLDENAKLIGLHEGKVADAAGKTLFNRATVLSKVAAAIDASRSSQPLRAPYTDHPSVRQAWIDYARRTAAPGGAAGDRVWTKALRSAGIDAGGVSFDDPADHFYPVFTAQPLEGWLSASGERGLTSRVLMLGGAPGTGKSFALTYAGTRLGEDLVLPIPAEISSELPLRQMLAQLHPDGDFDDPFRPFDGRMRITYVESVLNHFERLAAASSSGTLLVALDCDPDGAYWAETQEFWLHCALLCRARPALRLLVCGPSDDLRDELVNAGIAYEECRGIDQAGLETYCEALAHRLGRSAAADWARGQSAHLWNDPSRPSTHNPQLALCDAARIALTVRQSLLDQESTAP
jgi:S1-C subfamily serine protease